MVSGAGGEVGSVVKSETAMRRFFVHGFASRSRPHASPRARSATYSQTGANVTATHAAWNGSLAAWVDQHRLNGSYSVTNAASSSFTVNGAACS